MNKLKGFLATGALVAGIFSIILLANANHQNAEANVIYVYKYGLAEHINLTVTEFHPKLNPNIACVWVSGDHKGGLSCFKEEKHNVDGYDSGKAPTLHSPVRDTTERNLSKRGLSEVSKS